MSYPQYIRYHGEAGTHGEHLTFIRIDSGDHRGLVGYAEAMQELLEALGGQYDGLFTFEGGEFRGQHFTYYPKRNEDYSLALAIETAYELEQFLQPSEPNPDQAVIVSIKVEANEYWGMLVETSTDAEVELQLELSSVEFRRLP